MKKIRVVLQWSKPLTSFLKFNIDGSTIGKPGPAGIGGVLRDDFENVKLFSRKQSELLILTLQNYWL